MKNQTGWLFKGTIQIIEDFFINYLFLWVNKYYLA